MADTEKRIVRLDIVDNDLEIRDSMYKILDTFYLINPDKEKLNHLQQLIKDRHESDWWDGDYFINDYIKENFKQLQIADMKEFAW